MVLTGAGKTKLMFSANNLSSKPISLGMPLTADAEKNCDAHFSASLTINFDGQESVR